MYENTKDIGWKKKNNSSNGSYDDSLIKNQIGILDKKIDEEIEEVNSQLAQKANDDTVIKRGYATLNDFNEETRLIIQGMDSGQINAVLGEGNVMLNNLSSEIVETVKGNNLLTGTQSITFTHNGKEHTYNATNFIEVGNVDTKYSFNFNWVYVILFDLDNNFLDYYSLSNVTTRTMPANTKFALTCNNKTTIFERDTHAIIKGSDISNLIKDEKIIKKEVLEKLDNSSIEDGSISIEKLDDSFTTIEKGTNLYKYEEHLEDYAIEKSDGSTVTTNDFTNFIEVTPGATYASSLTYTQFYFLDADKKYLSQATIINSPAIFTPPDNGCKYVIIRAVKDENIKVCAGTSLDNVTNDKVVINPNLLPTTKGYESRWKGKKWIVIGDSISVLAEKNYHDFVGKDLGMTVTNLAVSGRTMLDGINWVDTMSSDYDLVSVMMGTNDQGYNCEIGSFNDGVDFKTNNSFYSRVQEIIRKLRAKNPKAQIVMITPIRRHGTGSQKNNEEGFMINALAKTTKDYANVIKDCCDKLGVHCLDLYECGLDPRDESIRSIYFMGVEDGTHPSALGQATFLAPKVRDFLEKIAPYELD